MMKKFGIVLFLVSLVSLLSVHTSYAQVKKNMVKKSAIAKRPPVKKTGGIKPPPVKKIPGTRVKMITDSGVIVIRLYDSTPLHRDNFVKLVEQGFYDSLLFHRLIPEFMIQGGDPLSKYAQQGEMLGNGGDELSKIKPEFKPSLFHKRGVLAAARDNNPEKTSSGCQFYIVTGKKYTVTELINMGAQMNRTFTAAEKKAYSTIGGVPWLDQGYTVFGEVEKGIEVADKISNVPRDENNRPLTDIRMKVEIVK